MLTLMASGSVGDYSKSDRSGLKKKIAKAAGVDPSLVSIALTAGSVLITATIAVPASTTAAAVQASLSSTLGSAAAASEALGVTVEAVPTITTAPPSPPPPSPSPPSASALTASPPLSPPPRGDDDDGLPVGAIIGAILGGVSGLTGLASACWYVRKKKAAKAFVAVKVPLP